MPVARATAFLVCVVAAAQPQIQSVVNAGAEDARVAAGTLVYLTGQGFSAISAENAVALGSSAAAVVGPTSTTRMLVQLPVDLPVGSATLVATTKGQSSAPFPIQVLDYAPAFYSTGSSGLFFTAANVPITAAKPATPGTLVTTFLVGLGATNPQLETGVAATSPAPTAVTPTLTVGGKMTSIVYAGLAAGLVGVYQVTFSVPPDVSPGNQTTILQIGTRVTTAPSPLPTSAGVPGITSVTNGATFQVKDGLHPVAPNSFISIFASSIGTADTKQSIFPASSYQGLSVLFNGKSAPLYFVFPSQGQINLVTPSDLGDTGTAVLTLTNAQGSSQAVALTLGSTDVGLFRIADPSNANRKNGAVLLANTAWDVMPASMATALGLSSCAGKPVTSVCGQPASTGDTIQIYFTGGGKATAGGDPKGTPLPTGQVAPADGSVLYQTVQMASVTIGGIPAQVLFSGIAPGNTGLYQINAVIPASVQTGDDVPLAVMLGTTQDSVTIAVR